VKRREFIARLGAVVWPLVARALKPEQFVRIGFLTGLPRNPAVGDFYFQAFNGSVSLPLLDMTTTVTGLLLLAGLSPAGMAASFAARPKPAAKPLPGTRTIGVVFSESRQRMCKSLQGKEQRRRPSAGRGVHKSTYIFLRAVASRSFLPRSMEPTMKRRQFLQAAGLGLATTAVAKPAIGQTDPATKWRLTSSFPKSLDTLYGASETIAKFVAEATDNQFQMQTFAAGEIVPGLNAMDAVSSGTVEACHTAPYFYFGKDPTLGAVLRGAVRAQYAPAECLVL
jgi:hypothetical protein